MHAKSCWGNEPRHPLQKHTTGQTNTRQDGTAGRVKRSERHYLTALSKAN